MERYFGPLPREYCYYFYILAIFFGVSFIGGFAAFLGMLVLHYKNLKIIPVINSILMLVNLFLAYLVNRLLHTMCVKSI